MQTIKEIQERENCECIKLTVSELKNILNEIGFSVDKHFSFYYENTSNEIKYNAYSCYIIDKKTKLSFANTNFGNTLEEEKRRNKLMEIRKNYFAVESKKNKLIVWDI